MVRESEDRHGTNFTVSIEAATGVTTGISAQDRARTVQAAVAPGARPEDLRQPGHVFPLMARPGGVLTRAGHTEAGCDLARLAGFEPAAVIVEILNEDGTMARRPELERFAAGARPRDRHDRRPDPLPPGQGELDRVRGGPAGRDRVRHVPNALVLGSRARPLHFALVRGEPSEVPPLVRVHLRDTPRDLIGIRGEHAGWTLRAALARIAREPHGIVVVLRPKELPSDIVGTGAHEHVPDAARRRVGAAHLRDRRADPARPRRHSHARAVGAASAARHFCVRPRDRRLRGVSAGAPDILAA